MVQLVGRPLIIAKIQPTVFRIVKANGSMVVAVAELHVATNALIQLMESAMGVQIAVGVGPLAPVRVTPLRPVNARALGRPLVPSAAKLPPRAIGTATSPFASPGDSHTHTITAPSECPMEECSPMLPHPMQFYRAMRLARNAINYNTMESHLL